MSLPEPGPEPVRRPDPARSSGARQPVPAAPDYLVRLVVKENACVECSVPFSRPSPSRSAPPPAIPAARPPRHPTPPAPTVTETFSGTIAVNGAMTFTFSTPRGRSPGRPRSRRSPPTPRFPSASASARWNGTTCQVTLANDTALQGTTILGNINGAGIFCARIYDAGKLVEATSFEFTVTHP